MLSTERLHLVALQKTDDEHIFRLRSDTEVNRFIDRSIPQNIEDARAFIKKIMDGEQDGSREYWVIRLKETNEMLGTICLWNFSEDKKTAEIGYELFPEQNGKGYMSEAIECVINYSFQKLGLNTIEAFTHRDNERSKNILMKHGFVWQPERRDEDVEHNVIYVLNR